VNNKRGDNQSITQVLREKADMEFEGNFQRKNGLNGILETQREVGLPDGKRPGTKKKRAGKTSFELSGNMRGGGG